MFHLFTDTARKVMALANQEAQRSNVPFIEPEHILLAMVREGSGVGTKVLRALGVDPSMVRERIEPLVKRGTEKGQTGQLAATTHSRQVLDRALEESRDLNHTYVGTEHLLLGLLAETEGPASEVLGGFGLTLDKARQAVRDMPMPTRPVISPVLTSSVPPPPPNTAILIASGDQRVSANVACWPAQRVLEDQAREALSSLGWSVVRGSPEKQSDLEPHGFVNSQAYGREVFAGIHPEAPLVVAEAVWQYSQHVLAGLCRHRGPILLLANWSGQWPGLVGVLNLRGSLTKAGVNYSMLWGEDFTDAGFRRKLDSWCKTGGIDHDLSHVRPAHAADFPAACRQLGERLAAGLQNRPAIMGVFDEGCMGMYNAIIPDRLLHSCGVYKERLSQSGLFAAMRQVPDAEADAVRAWCEARGMKFKVGKDEASELTDRQIREQCRMYIATLRLADRWGMDLVGIQYQLGLTDTCPASDLVEGLLNCSDRPPVRANEGPNAGKVLFEGRPVTHFNEVDECAGLDGLLTDRVWTAMGMPPDNTLHDLRWSDKDRSGTTEQEVWVFEISGAVPPSHLDGGYAGAVSERQPPMYFRQGGGGIKGVSRPGEVVWSRIYIEPDPRGVERLRMDIGLCEAIRLPGMETQRRWASTTSQWPIMHAVLRGVTRDQMMAKHQSNHIQVAYATDRPKALEALYAKAAMASALGISVNFCGGQAW